MSLSSNPSGSSYTIAVVDYHKGNLQSMARGIVRAGGTALVTDEPDVIEQAAGIVLPGVGAFADAIAFMTLSGQAQAIKRAIQAGTPFLGVCLGMQLLFARGSEGAPASAQVKLEDSSSGVSQKAWVPGLGILAGDVDRLPEAPGAKIPHVGWNSIDLTPVGRACPLFEGVRDGEYFYFTHSYACQPADSSQVMATTTHAQPFASAVWDGRNVFGVQFHPEKSSDAGAVVMRNFVNIVMGASAEGSLVQLQGGAR